ncbi:MAG: methyltransferase domain-containing protein [Immundisolibacteraceae bacterium]|nr:methyltransferase domain-containing protein [Immundisolibacteraceae bacterium]
MSDNNSNALKPELDREADLADSLVEALWQLESREVLQMLDSSRDGIAMQLAGPLGSVDLVRALPKTRSIKLRVSGSGVGIDGPVAVTDLARLPVRSSSIDVMVVLHGLEMVAKPAGLIHEIERVLVADGELVIAGFNPYSLFGLFSRSSDDSETPYRHSPSKVKQLLELADLQVERQVSNYFRPPIASSRWRGRTELFDRVGLRLLPKRGALYVLRARKRTYRITPVGIDFNALEQLRLGGLPTTARQGMGQIRLGERNSGSD